MGRNLPPYACHTWINPTLPSLQRRASPKLGEGRFAIPSERIERQVPAFRFAKRF